MAIYIPPGGRLVINKDGSHRITTPTTKSYSKPILPRGGAPQRRKVHTLPIKATPSPSRRGSNVDVVLPTNISMFDTQMITPKQDTAIDIFKSSVQNKPAPKPTIMQAGAGLTGIKTVVDILKGKDLIEQATGIGDEKNMVLPIVGGLLAAAGAGYGLEQGAEMLGIRGGAGFIGQAQGSYEGARVVKTWTANGTPFQLLSDGNIVVTKRNGIVKKYKPYKPMVFGKQVDAKKFARLAKKYRGTYKELHKLYGKRARRAPAPQRYRERC